MLGGGKDREEMSDLISRSELIKEINGIYLRVSGVRSGKGILSKCMDSYKELVIKIIKEQPTAFDAEKVVEQLEEEGQKMAEAKPTKPYGKSSPSCHRYYKAISVKKAIDIVKKGGVE